MSTVTELLFAVPGASDANRPAWLAERRTGITATEVRDLYLEQLGKPSYTRRHELLQRKLGRIPEQSDLSGVPVIAWGKAREPIIAETIRERYGIEPESRVFKLATNSGKLASPDGIGWDFDGAPLLSEIKTSGVAVPPGSEWFDKKGYLFQCMWGMRVLGARRCLYVWEHRAEIEPGVFEPGEQHFHWIDYDEQLATKLDDLADSFLAELKAAASTPWEGPVVDDELDTLAVNYLRFLGEEKSAGVAKTAAFNAVKKALAGKDRFQQETMLARITWTRGGETTSTERVERLSVDEEAAKSAHPAEWEALQKTAAALQKAEAAEERARARFEKAEERWVSLLPDHTKSEFVEEQVVRTVRANLTITAPKIKETKK